MKSESCWKLYNIQSKNSIMVMWSVQLVKIWPRMGLAYVHFWLQSLLEAPKWVKDSGNGPQMIPPTAPD